MPPSFRLSSEYPFSCWERRCSIYAHHTVYIEYGFVELPHSLEGLEQVALEELSRRLHQTCVAGEGHL